MRERAKDDEKDDEGRDPGPEFVSVYDLVAEQRNAECANSDDEDTSPAGNVVVYGVDKFSANNAIDTGPANAGEDVEDRDYTALG